MATTATLYASIASAAAGRGHLVASLGQTVQFSRAFTDGVRSCRYELVSYPPDYPCPSGWTDVNGVYQYAGESPPAITLSLWGKYLPRLRLNGASDVDTTGLIDMTTGIEVMSQHGLRDLVRGELDQFGGIASSMQDTLRAVENFRTPATETGLIERWHADFGVYTNSGAITEWLGQRGSSAMPITANQTVSTSLSASRRAVSFNGTSQGMVAAAMQRMGKCLHHLTVHIHMKAALNDATYRYLIRLSNSGAQGSTRLLYGQGNVAGYAFASAADTGMIFTASGAWTLNEQVLSIVRVANDHFTMYKDGVQVGTITDVSASPYAYVNDATIGYDGSGTPAYFYSGLIREIAIFNVAHSVSEVGVYAAARLGS